MKVLNYLLFLFVICIEVSCIYQQDELYYNDQIVRNPTEPDLKVIFLSFDEDSIVLRERTKFVYEITGNKEVYKTYIYVDSIKISSVTGTEWYFTIYPEDFSEGYHTITMEILTKSETNSIADQLGQEAFVSVEKWSIYIQKKLTGNSSISITDKLRISWEPYNAPDFNHYHIKRSNSVSTDTFNITNPLFVDEYYIGEGVYYYISVITKSGDELKWNDANTEKNIPFLEFSSTIPNLHYLIWDKPVNVDNLKKYQIFEKSGIDEILVFETENIEDTIYPLDEQFNSSHEYYLVYYPKQPEITADFMISPYETYKSFIIGHHYSGSSSVAFTMKADKHGFLFSTNKRNFYYHEFYENVTTSLPESVFENTDESSFRITPQRKYFTISNGYQVEIYDVEKKLKLKLVNMEDIAPEKYASSSKMLSDSGLQVVFLKNNKFWFLNLFNESFVDTIDASPYYRFFDFSGNGKYLLASDDSIRLLEIVDNYSRLTSKKAIAWDGQHDITFIGENDEYFCFFDGHFHFFLYQCNTGELISQIDLPTGTLFKDYDELNMLLLTTDPDDSWGAIIWNILDGTKVRHIESAMDMSLHDIIIYTSKGVYNYWE